MHILNLGATGRTGQCLLYKGMQPLGMKDYLLLKAW